MKKRKVTGRILKGDEGMSTSRLGRRLGLERDFHSKRR